MTTVRRAHNVSSLDHLDAAMGQGGVALVLCAWFSAPRRRVTVKRLNQILDSALDYGSGLINDQTELTLRVEKGESVTTGVFIDAALT